MIRLTLPLPDRTLSPNARAHWAAKARAVKAYRRRAMVEGRRAARPQGWPAAVVRITWHSRTRTRPDPDNALASCKPIWDGLQDAGVLAQDRALRFEPIAFAVDREAPRLEIEITPLADAAAA